MLLAGLLTLVSLASLAGYVLVRVDKRRARADARRVRERTLFLVALAGGAAGCWAGMYAVRHKTRHLSFVLGMPALALAQAAGFLWLVCG